MTLPKITSKQKYILFLIYRFRFLTTSHIQKFFNHKNSNRSNAWLKDLLDKGYVNRIYSRTIGDINKPAIYYLALKAKQELKNNKEVNQSLLNRVYREKKKSPAFVDYCLFLTDLYFSLIETTKQSRSELFFYTRTDLTTFKFLSELDPHAYVAIENPGKETKRFFVEVIEDNTPRFAIKIRLDQYINFQENGEWEENTNFLFPTVLLICSENKTKRFLINYIQELETDTNFRVLEKKEEPNNVILLH